MKENRVRVLLIEDNPSDAHLIKTYLSETALTIFEVKAVDCLQAGLHSLKESCPDVILTDMSLPDSFGIETFRVLNGGFPHLPIVVMTGLESEEIGLQTVKEGAQDYFIKSDMNSRIIAKSLSYAIERKAAETELRALNEQLRKSNEEKEAAEKKLRDAMDAESAIAGSIQRALLTEKPPETFGIARLAFYTNPSEAIDGDFFDFFSPAEQMFDLVIADVMGKGVPAALIAAAAKAAFLRVLNRLLVKNPSGFPQITDILTGVNGQLAEQLDQLSSFITLIYARFDLQNKTLAQVNCGHPPAVHHIAEKNSFKLLGGEKNMPLGLVPKPEFNVTETSFAAGDLLFFYTDGITEARDPKGRFFGTGGLCEVLGRNLRLSPKKLIGEVRRSIREFSLREALSDDFTAIVVRMDPAD